VVRLSILDQSIACVGREPAQAIRDTVDLAVAAERYGFERFWVSEHHSNEAIVGTAPEVLLGAIAARTHSIRIGAAGIMLPHYSPLKVAEQFRVLDALAPGRIDLGLGRAPGSDGRTAYALNPAAAERPAQFPHDVRDLSAWVSGTPLVDGHPFGAIRAQPTGATSPEIWILGSSDYGAQVAAHFGLPYAFAWFFTDGQGGEDAMHIYRHHFRPSARHPEPKAALCVFALAAPTEEEARHHFASRARFRLLRDRGIFAPLLSPESALAHDYTEAERARMESYFSRAFVGTPSAVVERISGLAKTCSADEVAIVTWAYDERVRHESYRLIARAAHLKPRHRDARRQ
jgi:luciferase family oxidoreductase group 1